MAGTKPGFMMYHHDLRILSRLDADTFKRMIMVMCDYSEYNVEPTELDNTEMVLFELFRVALDKDTATYNARAAAGASGGQKSGETRRNKTKQNEASRNKTKQNEAEQSGAKPSQANEPITNNQYPSSNNQYPSSTTPSGFSSSGKPTEEEAFPPTREMVEKYAAEKGWTVDAEDFLRRCEDAGWTDGEGQPIRNWRMWLKGYLLKAAKPVLGGARGVDPRLAALEAMRGAK